MAVTYLELVDDRSVSTAGAAPDTGRSLRQWLAEGIVYTDIIGSMDGGTPGIITDILGTTAVSVPSDGKLNRTPPLADPMFPFWFASGITNIVGVGTYAREAVGDLGYEVPPFPEFAAYNSYIFTVESTPRPYAVTPDSGITVQSGSWYNDSGTPQTFSYFPEWVRYTDFDVLPQNDSITSQRGQMRFQSTGAASGKAFPGMPRMFLPNSIVRFHWFGVPLRYVLSTKSYLTRWRGRINQNDWYGFPAGSLLYLNFNPAKRYTPPVPGVNDGSVGVTTFRKLVDLELTFLYTTRAASDLPAAPANRNFIQAGHNLLPWLRDRQFHFAMSVADTFGTPVAPSWYSFPLELLWADPDSPAVGF